MYHARHVLPPSCRSTHPIESILTIVTRGGRLILIQNVISCKPACRRIQAAPQSITRTGGGEDSGSIYKFKETSVASITLPVAKHYAHALLKSERDDSDIIIKPPPFTHLQEHWPSLAFPHFLRSRQGACGVSRAGGCGACRRHRHIHDVALHLGVPMGDEGSWVTLHVGRL